MTVDGSADRAALMAISLPSDYEPLRLPPVMTTTKKYFFGVESPYIIQHHKIGQQALEEINSISFLQFFSNDFTEDRWRKAALKNAFVLLGKQRFEHAAAFFLLGGALKDALEVFEPCS